MVTVVARNTYNFASNGDSLESPESFEKIEIKTKIIMGNYNTIITQRNMGCVV